VHPNFKGVNKETKYINIYLYVCVSVIDVAGKELAGDTGWL